MSVQEATIFSFAEETVWNGEDFRSKRKRVDFRVFSVGRALTGEKIDVGFSADYGLWWDQDDEVLMWHLEGLGLSVKWRDLVFHKKMDKSGIDVFDPETDALVARIEVRAYEGRRLSDAEMLEREEAGEIVCFQRAVDRMRAVENDCQGPGSSGRDGQGKKSVQSSPDPTSANFVDGSSKCVEHLSKAPDTSSSQPEGPEVG